MNDQIELNVEQYGNGKTRYAEGPMVLQRKEGSKMLPLQAIVSFTVTSVDGEAAYVECGDGNFERRYVLDSPSDLMMDATSSASKIEFKSQGTMYSVRRFTDDDGFWASTTGESVPAKVLEELVMANADALAGDATEPTYGPEELYALSDGDGKIVYLVYSGAGQTYTRQDGAWVPLDDPNGDVLDDLYIDYPRPGFVEYFDKNQKKGVTTADMEKFNSKTDVAVTASATNFRFASVINKKD